MSKDDIILCLWNNGPREIAFNLTTDYYTLKVCQTINNESLSYIYNLFINEVESEKYILLDHDSILKYDYVLECLNSTSDCIIPNIIVGNNIQSPKTYSIQSFNKGNTVLAIGSGICISKNYVRNFDKYLVMFLILGFIFMVLIQLFSTAE